MPTMQTPVQSQSYLTTRTEWLFDMETINAGIPTKQINADEILRYPSTDDLVRAIDYVEIGGAMPRYVYETVGKSAVWSYLIKQELTAEEQEQASNLILEDEHIFQFVIENLRNKKIEATLINNQLELIDERFIQGIEHGMALGYIPQDFNPSTLAATLDTTTIHLFDGIDYGSTGILGQYSPGQNRIGLLKAYEFDIDLYEKVLTHERLHALSGGTFREESDEIFSFRTRAGFSQDLKPRDEDEEGENVKNTAINEAITEHLSLSIIGSEWEIINPFKRKDDFVDAVYFSERYLLSDMIEKSEGLIDLKTITKAYFEDTEPGLSIKYRREMIKQFRKAFADGTISRFEKLCELRNANMLCKDSEFSKMIHPPKFNTDGSVLTKGYIKLTTPRKLGDSVYDSALESSDDLR